MFSSPAATPDNAGPGLTPSERRALVDDIGRLALTLGKSLFADRIASADTKQGKTSIPASPASTTSTISPIERLALLHHVWPAIVSALQSVAQHPVEVSVPALSPVSLARSRGGKVGTDSLARNPRALAAWNAAHSTADERIYNRTGFAAREVLISERRLHSVRDAPANRFVVTLLEEVAEEAETLGRLAAFCGEEGAWQVAGSLAQAARRWRKRAFLADCPPLRPEEVAIRNTGNWLLRCPPAYRALFTHRQTLYQNLQFDWSHSPALWLPALEAWHLYEIWCFLVTADALTAGGWQLAGGNMLRLAPDGLRLTLATGRASRLRFRRIPFSSAAPSPVSSRRSAKSAEQRNILDLYYQPWFASVNQIYGISANASPLLAGRHREGDAENVAATNVARELPFSSRSHAMQPDIALHYANRLILLDPKFKAYDEAGSEQEDVNKMHTYRDAIARRRGAVLSSESGVIAAWCLFPGVSSSAAAAPRLRAYPQATREMPFGTAGVGALPLRPGSPEGKDTLAALLTFLTAEK